MAKSIARRTFNNARNRKFRNAGFRLESLEPRNLLAVAVNDSYATNEGCAITTGAIFGRGACGWFYNDDILDSGNAYPSNTTQLGTLWNAVAFDMTTSEQAFGEWTAATGPFEHDNADDVDAFDTGPAPTLLNYPQATEKTAVARRPFTLTAQQAAATSGSIDYVCDDGCIIYINGAEVFRTTTMPAGAATVTTIATGGNEAGYTTAAITIPAGTLLAGDNVLAIENHHRDGGADAGFDVSLSLTGGPPSVAANDTTVGAAMYVVATQPTNGTVTMQTDGNFTYRPNANYSGPDSFTYTVTDSGVPNSAMGTVNLTVTPVNDPPTAANDTYFGGEGGIISVTSPTATSFAVIPLAAPGWDVNDELLIATNQYPTDAGSRNWTAVDYDVSSSTIGGTAAAWETNQPAPFDCNAPNCTGTVAAISPPDYTGPKTNVHVPPATETTFLARKTFTLTAAQAAATSGTITYTCDSGCIMYINGVRAGSSPNMTAVTAPTPISFAANDGDEVVPHATLTVGLGGAGQPALIAGTNVIAIEIHNNSVASSDIGFDLSLDLVPLAGVLNNDSDPEGGALTATIVDQSNLAGKGTFVFNQNGTFTFDANPGVSGNLTFTYTASDGTNTSAPATVTISLSAINSATYTANNDIFSATEDMALTVNATSGPNGPIGPGLTANDSHPGDESDLLTITITQQPLHGAVTLAADMRGGFTYTPGPNYVGSDAFRYRVNDGFADSNEATVTINIGPVADAPVANTDQYTGVEGSPVTVSTAGGSYLATGSSWFYSDNGSDQDTVNPNWKAGPALGFNPATATGWNATAQPAELGYGDGDEVTNISFGPNANTKYITTYFWRQFNVAGAIPANLRLGLSVDDGAIVYINGVEVFQSANLTDPVTFTTETGAAGDDATPFIETIVPTAGLNLQAAGNTISVEVHQDSPTSSDISFDLFLVNPAAGVLANDYDPEGDALVNAMVVTQPTGGNVVMNPDGTFTFTPNPGVSGAQTFTYTVSDGTLTSAAATVTIMITADDTNPYTAVNDTFAATEDTALTVTGNSIAGSAQGGLMANDQHPGDENDPVTFAIVTQPTRGTLTLTANTGGFVYTPEADFNGTDTFVYSVNDSFNPISQATVTLNVAAVDDAPEGSGDTYNNITGPFTVPVGTTYLARRSMWEYLDTMNNGVQDDPASVPPPAPEPYPTDAGGNQWFEEDFDTSTSNGDGAWLFASAVFSGDETIPLNGVADAGGPVGTTELAGMDCEFGTPADPDNCVTTYLFRTNFNVANGASLTAVGINLLADDGAIVYLNGVEVLRHNMAAAPAAVDSDDFATVAGDEDTYVRFDNVTFPAGTLHNGNNVVAVELHQSAIDSSDVAFDMAITSAGPASVLSNDVDKESDALTAAITTQPANGSVTLNANGTFTYTPNAGFSGADTFTYTVSGLVPAAAATTVTLNVTQTTTCTPGDADLDNNLVVNRADLALLVANYGSTTPGAPGDVNCDNRVGVRDLVLLRNLMTSPSPAAPGALVDAVDGNAVDRVLAGLDRAIDAVEQRAPRAANRLTQIRDRISDAANSGSDNASEIRDAARRVIRATRGRIAAHARAIGDLFDRTA